MRLKEIRESKNISQSELAKKTGVNQSLISMIESKKRDNPSISTVVALCDGLDCTLEEMIGRQTEGNG